MARTGIRQIALFFLLLVNLSEAEDVTVGKRHGFKENGLKMTKNENRSIRVARSYLPLDKIGGGIVLRELGEKTDHQPNLINYEFEKSTDMSGDIPSLGRENRISVLKSSPRHRNFLKRKVRDVTADNSPSKKNFDEIDRFGFNDMGKRVFDEMDKFGFNSLGKRNFDEIDRSGFRSMGKKNFDEIDSSGFRNIGKKNFDEIDRSGFSNMRKRNFDEIDRSGFRSMKKKNFDEIDKAGFRSMDKRNFDEIDKAGFRSFNKRNIDEINYARLRNNAKRHFDEIDRSGFNNIGKRNFYLSPEYFVIPSDKFSFSDLEEKPERTRMKILGMNHHVTYDRFPEINFIKKNFDEIDKSGFTNIGKKNFDEIDKSGFTNIGKKNFDEIDKSGFSHIGKRLIKKENQFPLRKITDELVEGEGYERSDFSNASREVIDSLLKTAASKQSSNFSSSKIE